MKIYLVLDKTEPKMVVAVSEEAEKEKSWPQVIAILTASLVGFTSGYLYAWPSPFLLKISQDNVTYNISEEQASYFAVCHSLGMLVLPILISPVVNIFGRKKTLLIAELPMVTSLLMKAFVTDVWLLYLARFLAGSADAIVFAGLPVYIGEVSTPKVRGIWGNSFIIAVFTGQFIINVVGSYCSVADTSYIGLVIPVLFPFLFYFVPESPYYLIMRGKEEEARQSLRFLRGKQHVQVELDALITSVKEEMQLKGSWADLIKIKANRKALIAGLFLRTSQLLTGVYVFMSYTQFIFEKAGGSISYQTSAIIYTGLTVFMYLCSAYASKLIGRRKAYMSSLLLAGIIVLSEAVYFYIDSVYTYIDLEPIKWFPLVGMLSFVVVSSFGVGIIPTLMLGELFATSVKSKGISLLTVAFAANIIITNNIFYYFNSYTGLYGPFFLFGACNMLFTVLAYFIVPETKGKTLEEIQETLKNM
ncbi:facilitated trehalose transporter Tret1-like [Diorhabda sublineata]|uniref:facilitated trehalose transporter Tret1-like n=1 Tax=Diorhabda sublineata TaxID=1163346 RepID=UPI0024E12F2C|nr:facilitated trehalose transporter Tret1-like [Diorhabda sublineata]